ncbi:MAG: HlyD family type I secretion periplasmic adaptor subunit [Magnetococcales bacterium]|nr:HlyD family type I secretion periplasmic adaptor subunit [Magnetococcales bacterium]MBF0151200.1 HlyD family type I secretion periplasmic adaptor subunit [Magnetococcales bacterium]MBF0174442.1 HlyD family type I secretion periplasmic adaptor subunit [Magnetococcales bacterium]MBF0632383.1 HlyD family type I secretion periplasmic adaptor subunit [Magnetococcales bacterium]
MFEGVRRHWGVAMDAWRAEREQPSRAVRGDLERAFLPAVLEIAESPPAPHGRSTAWLIMTVFTVGLLWAIIGTVEIHAVTQGKVIPSGRVKVIQPLEAGVVQGIHVKDGVMVEAGQILIELDPTESTADVVRLEQEWMEAEVESARLRALAPGGEGDPLKRFAPSSLVADEALLLRHRSMLQAEWGLFQASLKGIDQEMAQKRAEMGILRSEMGKMQARLPLVEKRADARKQLAESGHGSWLVYYEAEEERVTVSGDLRSQAGRLEQAKAAMAGLKESRHRTEAQFQQDILNRMLEAERRKGGLRQDLEKARKRQARQHLTAPVAGLVQQLAVHTLGGVVTPAQNLLVIVPVSEKVEVEVMVLNKDAGFVSPSLAAAVKVDAFPFTKYGTIPGHVIHVSKDAVEHETLGLVFTARIELDRAKIQTAEKEVPLTPGMSVTADITIGDRQLIEYLLAPLMQIQSTSFREH